MLQKLKKSSSHRIQLYKRGVSADNAIFLSRHCLIIVKFYLGGGAWRGGNFAVNSEVTVKGEELIPLPTP